ncbi:AEC family transporter [Pinirhizobacter soli]|uniref:AEC family transporter n=1 Tax=Pinirhizobacter soli TaxID=2786953 RepID=UPI00202A1510|nr:AEC family transporter [Pinirhizobacter soli]
MSPLVTLFACLLLGIACRRFARLPEGIVPGINWWVLNIALPALVLALVPRLHPEPSLWLPAAGAYVVFFGAWLVFATVGRFLGWSRARIGCLTLVCGLGNTSFMGYPMMQALHGTPGLSVAVVADQLGTFPLLAIGGIAVASLYSGSKPSVAVMARRLFTFPAFLALLLGVAIGMLGGWPATVEGALEQVGGTLTPLALFSVGLQFRLHLEAGQAGALVLGLAWKLMLAPVLVLLLGLACGYGGVVLVVAVLQAAMAPMISAAILADQYNLEPRLGNTVLGAGIALSLLTITAGNALLMMMR